MMSFAVVAIVKATTVCGAAFFLSRLCRRTRASIRHLLFVLAFAALAAIPGVGAVLPIVAVTVPATAAVDQTPDLASAVLSSIGADPARSSAPSVSADTAPVRFVTITQVITVAWLIGVALFLMPVVVGFWQVRRLRTSASPWSDRQARVQALAPAPGVHRRVDVLLHEGVTGPMTCGVLKPAIILPVSARQWDEASLRRALRHELEHVARWDFLALCVSRVICAAYWFHPLVWAAWRRLRLEAERACDDAVVREDDASDYASLLVSMAQQEPAGRRPLLAMAGRHDLAIRIAAVLDHNQRRGRVGRRRASGLIAAGTVVILGIAPVTAARAMPQTSSGAAPAQTFAAASIKRSPLPAMRLFDGQLTATNVTVRELLIFAFGVADIDDAPWWANGYRFDIVAKMPSDNQGPGQGSKSLQSFLAERFKLVAHRGSKELPVYALVVARPGGSLGPRMTRSDMDCSPDSRPTCGMSSTFGRMAGRGVTMAELTRNLPAHMGGGIGRPTIVDRELIDRTGLNGRFDFTLQWTPDAPATSRAPDGGQLRVRPFASVLEASSPRFLAALEEQLGLKVESQLAPKPVLVIDSIEAPVEN